MENAGILIDRFGNLIVGLEFDRNGRSQLVTIRVTKP